MLATEKTHMGNFLMGTSEVWTFQMNQLHNNDVTNVNRQCTDRLNEQVTDDDIMNVNGQSADDSADESHKMMSQMHQMMSQQQQVVETTPGHSQKLFKTPETVNLTEKNESSHQGTTGNTMMESHFSGLLVR